MAGVFCCGYGLGRRLTGIDMLAVSAVIVLVWKPTDLFDAGFQLSFGVVGALLAASTGVVGASVVAMGVISLPVMLKYNYDKKLATGAANDAPVMVIGATNRLASLDAALRRAGVIDHGQPAKRRQHLHHRAMAFAATGELGQFDRGDRHGGGLPRAVVGQRADLGEAVLAAEGGQSMPSRLTAENSDTRVRLVIDHWIFFD